MLALLLPPLARASADAPVVTLTDPIGPPTSTTTITGTGFEPSEFVAVRFDARAVDRVGADGTGAFSADFRVPGSAIPGIHRVSATGESSGLFAQVRFVVRTDWLQERFDPEGSAHNPYENMLNPATVSRMVPLWSRNLGTDTPPVVGGGTLYVTDSRGVHALDAETGAFEWTAEPEDRDSWGGVAGSDHAIFTSSKGPVSTVWAMDARNGDVLWQTGVAAADRSTTPVVAGGKVFYPFPATLHAFDAATGTSLWSFSTTGFGSDVTVGLGKVFVHTRESLYALDAATGAVVWQIALSGSQPPSIAGGTVFVGADDDRLRALDASTGAELWSVPVEEPSGGPAVADGVVYSYFGSDLRVGAFDAATGSELWTTPSVEIYSFGNPVVAAGVVYVSGAPIGIYESDVYALDAATGDILWRKWIGLNPFTDTPVVVNGKLYVMVDEMGFGDSDKKSPPLVVYGLPDHRP